MCTFNKIIAVEEGLVCKDQVTDWFIDELVGMLIRPYHSISIS